jgi:hypothetical protein
MSAAGVTALSYKCLGCQTVDVPDAGAICPACDEIAAGLCTKPLPEGQYTCSSCSVRLVADPSEDCDVCEEFWSEFLQKLEHVNSHNSTPADEKATTACTNTTTASAGQGAIQTVAWKKCQHNGIKPVTIGGFPVHLGAQFYLDHDEVLAKVDTIITLTGNLPNNLHWGQRVSVIDAELPDRGGVPKNWPDFIQQIAAHIQQGGLVCAYCIGSHGRTGTFGASLIAIMEPDVEDPIAAIRERHCEEAVESMAQATAIFALKGMELPEKYKEEFTPKASTFGFGGAIPVTTFKQRNLYDSVTQADCQDKAPFTKWWERRSAALLKYWEDFSLGDFRKLTDEERTGLLRRIYHAWYTGDFTDVPKEHVPTPTPDCLLCKMRVYTVQDPVVRALPAVKEGEFDYFCDWCYGRK